jgi:hypothetical protein
MLCAISNAAIWAAPVVVAAPPQDDAASKDSDPKRQEARELARKAIELMHAERWAEAQPLLERAYQLVPAPTIALLEGEALEQLGRWLAAREEYRVARDTPLADDAPQAFRSAVKQAGQRLQRLEERTPKLVISVRGHPPNGSLRVVIDTAPVDARTFESPVSADPGEHLVVAWLDGKEVVRERVTLSEGETRQVVIGLVGAEPTRTPAPPPVVHRSAHTTQHTLGWVLVGLGAAGTTFGVVTGAMMLDAKGNLDAQCKPECPSSAHDELSRFRTTRTLSSVGYVAGVSALGLGAVLVLTGSTDEQAPATEHKVGSSRSVGLYAAGTFVGLRGSF